MTQERLAGWEGDKSDFNTAVDIHRFLARSYNEGELNGIAELVRRHRLATIEECAKVADERSQDHLAGGTDADLALYRDAASIAKAIRNLAPPSHNTRNRSLWGRP